MKNTAMEARLRDEILGFLDSRKSLQIASLGDNEVPFASYAPFARDDNSLYVLLSDIAIHARNLRHHPKASVLVIEDEDSAEELFARKRVAYEVTVEEIAVDSDDWHNGVEMLANRHGERPRNLSQLSDFHLFRLRPVHGRYVKGFGKAYALASGSLTDTAIDHLRDGHKPRDQKVA